MDADSAFKSICFKYNSPNFSTNYNLQKTTINVPIN